MSRQATVIHNPNTITPKAAIKYVTASKLSILLLLSDMVENVVDSKKQ